MTERMYLFLCEDLEPGLAQLELDERLETSIVPWDEALAMVDDGRIEDAKTMLALTICDRLRRRRMQGRDKDILDFAGLESVKRKPLSALAPITGPRRVSCWGPRPSRAHARPAAAARRC